MTEFDKPIVTVGNLCYNTGQYVVKTLDSILNQTYQNFELIIVDDASSDNSVELIEDWIKLNSVKCTFIKHEENKGICKSANEIIALAKGTYISLVGDDLWDADFLQTCVDALNLPEAVNVSLVYTRSNVLYFNEKRIEKGADPIEMCKNYPRRGQLFEKIYNDLYLMKNPHLADVLYWINPVIAICTCVKVESIRAVGGYNENLPFEDYDMWFKLSKISSFLFVNSEKATYVRYSESFTNNRVFDLLFGKMAILLNNYNQIKYSDTKKYCTLSLFEKCFELSLNKNEVKIKTTLMILCDMLKVSPVLFLKVSAFLIYRYHKLFLKRVFSRFCNK